MNTSTKLLNLVKNKFVNFIFYSDGALWYTTDCGFEFPVPVSDSKEVGTATFMAVEKATLYMRYIRKHLEMIEKAKQEQSCKQVT